MKRSELLLIITGKENTSDLTKGERLIVNKCIKTINDVLKIRYSHEKRMQENYDTAVVAMAKEMKSSFSPNEVKDLIGMIYSEFAELPRQAQSYLELKRIIGQELEQHPIKPVQIFVK